MWGFGGKLVTKVYVVRCKRCQRDVPAGTRTFPAGNIVVRCCLCDELRRYRPAEVYLARPHHLVKVETWADLIPSN